MTDSLARENPAGRVRVIIADDHPLYREGVARAIKERPDLELVGEAEDGRHALELIRKHVPEVALLDMRMEHEGLTVLRAVVRDELNTRIVFLSAYLDNALAYAAVEAGAAGYLSKGADRQVICDALRAAARGETVLSAEIQAALAKEIRSHGTDGRSLLTEREREILTLAAQGLSAPEMGRHLHLSAATVKTHLGHLYEKLGVSDRAAAVAEAMRRGLVE